MKKISVIVPIYNVEEYIERCIDSIINQTYNELEVILVNDASTDNSGKICEELLKKDNRIKLYHNEKNLGLAGARNVGLKLATGELISFIDSDDTIDIDMFEILVNNLENYDADISACKGRDILPDGRIRDEIIDNDIKIYQGEDILIDFLVYEKDISAGVCDKIFRKDLIKNITFNENLKVNEDRLFTYYALRKCNTYVQQNISKYNYHIRKGSLSNIAKFSDYDNIIEVSRIMQKDIEKSGTQKQKEGAKLNLQLAILSACRKAAKENEVYNQREKYNNLVKEFKINAINYKLLNNKKRKIECFMLKNFPYMYSLIVRIYQWRRTIK